MSFLDAKEQVIVVELTQHGKRLLSQGMFEPKFYSFDDVDLLYDGNYAFLSESQNDISARIKEQSPQLMPQYNFCGIETNFQKYKKNKILEKDNPNFKNALEDKQEENYFAYTIGDSTETDKLPAFNVVFLNGSMNEFVTFLSSSVYPHVRIPQINSSIEYDIFIGDQYETTTVVNDREKKIYDDGSYVEIEQDYLLLDMEELNTLFEEENYEIEVFKVEKDILDSNKEVLKPLQFKTYDNTMKKDILVLQKTNRSNVELDTNDVEYYFDLYVDNEIDSDIMCKAIKGKKTKNIFMVEEWNCRDKKQSSGDIYKDSVDDIDECEV